MKVAKKILKILIFACIIAFVVYIYYNVIGKIIDIAKLQGNNSGEIKKYLQSFGFTGALIIALMEALQMIVIFIPAEFVQISAGLSYPLYFMLPICIVGIWLGATIIYLLTNVFHLKMDLYKKADGKIRKFVSAVNTNTSMTAIMYILFIMPAIPFGAICYFGASSKISYKRYSLICATGVIPSVLSSFVVGNTMSHFLGKGTLQFAIAVSVVIVLMLLLLALLVNFVQRKFLSKNKLLKPNAFLYFLLYPFIVGYYTLKYRIKVDKKPFKKIKGPAIVIAPHTSAMDFVCIAKALFPKRINFVINEYYLSIKALKPLLKGFQIIPKKLFTADVSTIKGIIKAKNSNDIIILFPEGRLSTCGVNFQMAEGTAKLIKKLEIDVYSISNSGGFLSSPKWAKYSRKSQIKISGQKLFDAHSLQNLSADEVEQKLQEAITYNDFESNLDKKFSCKDFAKGVCGIIYKCPVCNEEFCLTEEKNALTCSNCNSKFVFDSYNKISGNQFENIAQWYEFQCQQLAIQMDSIKLETSVDVAKVMSKSGKNIVGNGVCTLDKDKFLFSGQIDGNAKEFEIKTENLEALPFSADEEFELYFENELYYFYPIQNKHQCVKWSAFVDEITKNRKVEQKNESK